MSKSLEEKFECLDHLCDINSCDSCILKDNECDWSGYSFNDIKYDEFLTEAVEKDYSVAFPEEESTPPPTLLKVDEIEEVIGLENASITLTKSQIDNLIEFFDDCFIQMIKNDTVSQISYLCDMCDIYKKLEDVQAELDI